MSSRRTGAVGYLSQDPSPRGTGLDGTALAHVLSARGLDAASRRLDELHQRMADDASPRNVRAYSDAEDAFRNAGGYAADSEVRRIAAGLGLGADRLDLPITALSGGERRRVELTRILFAGSDLLLLDEPTNHLDIDAKQWLMQFLRSYRGALLVISHDLELLDQAITRVLHIDEGELVEYRGTYSQYLVAREGRRASGAPSSRRARRSEIDRLQRARQLDARPDREAGAHRQDARPPRREAHRQPGHRGARRAQGARAACPSRRARAWSRSRSPTSPRRSGRKTVFEDVTFDVGRGERMLVLGLNGAGKTTLLKTLVGELEADLGTVSLGHQVSLGYYAQEHEGITRGPQRARAHARRERRARPVPRGRCSACSACTARSCSRTRARSRAARRPSSRSTMLVAGQHNLLLLDEPTNNLDPPSRAAIGAALRTWKGAMVLVSHDTEFVTELEPDRVLVMPDGTVDHWSDDLVELVALA